MRLRLLPLALAIAACNSRAPTCEQRTRQLAARLAPLSSSGPMVLVTGVDVPVRKGSTIAEPGPVLTIDAGGRASLRGETLADGDALRAQLANGAQPVVGPRARRLYVAADKRARVADLRRWLEAAPTELQVSLVTVDPARTPAPTCPASLGKRCGTVLGGADPSQRASEIAKVMQEAIGHCAPLAKLFGSLAMADPESKGAILKAHLPEAIQQCDCGQGMDVDVIEYVFLLLFGAGEARYVAVATDGLAGASAGDTVETWLSGRR